jgi:hypothetical protein
MNEDDVASNLGSSKDRDREYLFCAMLVPRGRSVVDRKRWGGAAEGRRSSEADRDAPSGCGGMRLAYMSCVRIRWNCWLIYRVTLEERGTELDI